MKKASENAPWAKLRVTRKQYAASRPWKKAGMKKENFEKLLDCLPDEFISEVHDLSDAEDLVKAMFGESS